MRYTQVPATCDLTCNTIDMEDMAGSSGRYRVEEMAAAKEVDFEAPPPALSHSSSGDSLASLSSSSSEDDAFGPRTPRVDCDVVRPIARSDTWKPDRAKFGSGKLHTGSLASPNLPHAAAGNGSAAGLPGTPGATAGDKPVQGHLLSQTESALPSLVVAVSGGELFGGAVPPLREFCRSSSCTPPG